MNTSSNPSEDISSTPAEQASTDTTSISTIETAEQVANNLVELRLKMSQKTLLMICGFVVVSLAVVVIGIWLIFFQTEPTTTNQTNDASQQLALAGELALAEGQVQIKSSTDWTPASSGQTIKQGDSIKTAADSRAVINLDDGSAIRLDQSSEVKLATISNDTIVIEQLTGRSYHRVEPGQLTYKVQTPQATTTALGTIFSTANTTTDDTVYVLESKVKVQPKTPIKDLDGNEVEVATGKQASITAKEVKVDTINLDALKEDFYVWNDALDKGQPLPSMTPKPTEVPEPTATQTPNPSASISLTSGGVGPGKATLVWKLNGVTAPQGFKIIKSHSGTPTFGKDEAVYISDSKATSYTWTNIEGKATNFRVGIYNGSGISLYSNTITLTPQPKPVRAPYTGTITLATPTLDGTKVNLSWTANKQDLVDGWKVVVSTSPNPVYPDNSVHYASPGDRNATIKNLESGETYYIRVGAWIDSKVATNAYSNQVSVTIP